MVYDITASASVGDRGVQVEAGPETPEHLAMIAARGDDRPEHRGEGVPGTSSQSAQLPYSVVSPTRVSPTSNTTASITLAK